MYFRRVSLALKHLPSLPMSGYQNESGVFNVEQGRGAVAPKLGLVYSSISIPGTHSRARG